MLHPRFNTTSSFKRAELPKGGLKLLQQLPNLLLEGYPGQTGLKAQQHHNNVIYNPVYQAIRGYTAEKLHLEEEDLGGAQIS